MESTHIDNLAERQETYRRFWSGEKLGRPVLCVQARRDEPLPHAPSPPIPADPEALWLDPDFVIPNRLATLARTRFIGDSIPHVVADLGPGSLASYLGSPTECHHTTVWYHPALDSLSDPPPRADEENPWWRRHFALLCRLAEIGRDEGFYVALPDLIEGLDTLASLRGSQDLVLDLMDPPRHQAIRDHLDNITRLYLYYYDQIYARLSDEEGWSLATYLEPYGPGRACKIQCDFAALMDPTLFQDFAVPFIEQQAAHYDYVSYHLDGPGAIYSAPMVAAVEKIRVVQWIPGAGAAPEYAAEWYRPVFDPLIRAGKVVQLLFMELLPVPEEERRARLEEIVGGVTRLIEHYGPDSFWLTFKYGYSEALIEEVLLPAAAEWRVTSGS